MTAGCTGTPVSWLRLEQLALDGAGASADAEARAHVDGCPACRACLDTIRRDAVALPALPLVIPAPAWWRVAARRWQWAGGALAMTAALGLWIVVRGPDDRAGDPTIGARLAVKGGGTLLLSLVRDRDGAIDLDPTTVADGDRWKVRVTCDRSLELDAEVVVYQGTGPRLAAFFPLPAQRLGCGNQITVDGAFVITDAIARGGAQVCIAVGDDGRPDRAALRRGPVAGSMACRSLAAAPGDSDR